MNLQDEIKLEQNGGTFGLTVRVPTDKDDRYKQYAYDQGRKEFAIKLFEQIEKTRNPCVVVLDTHMSVRKGFDIYSMIDEIRLEAEIIPVEYKHVVMQAWDQISLVPPKWKELSFVDRIRYMFTGKIK